ncbi:MAG: ChrR family anti-sigma-E factor [Micropepsaceae bacterium]
MSIHHHLDSATMLALAAGTLDPALSVVAAAHIAWCPVCLKATRDAEEVGGALLAELDETSVSDDCRSRTLDMLDRATVHRFPKKARAPSDVPSPLGQLLGGQKLADLRWKTKAPGWAMVDLPAPAGSRGKLFLVRVSAGVAMPVHGHGGVEMTLILSGAYNDRIGRFAKGDVADLDVDIEHQPIVEGDAPCVCLVATEAPTRFKSWAVRLIQPFIGI